MPCPASFDTKGKLGNHVATHHNGLPRRRYLCTICITTPTAELPPLLPSPLDQTTADASLLLSLSQPPPPHRAEGVTGFSTHAELRAHITAAHPPVCSLCGFAATRQAELRAHCRAQHEALEDRQTWVCGWDACGLGFTKKSNLTTHTRTVHQGLKPFVCEAPECGKRFGHKMVLVKHVAAKHSERPAPSKAAKRRAARKKHTRQLGVAELLTGVGYEASGRDLRCAVLDCSYRFMRMYDLKVHLSAASGHGFDEAQVEELILGLEADKTALDSGSESDTEDEYCVSDSEWSLAGSETEDEVFDEDVAVKGQGL